MTDQDRLIEIRQRRAAIGEVNWAYRPDLAPDSASNDILQNARILEDGYIEEDSIVAYDEGTIDDDTGRFIAHAPDDIDWLIAEIERLKAELVAALPLNLTLEREEAPHTP
jgi:hypothetical protein